MKSIRLSLAVLACAGCLAGASPARGADLLFKDGFDDPASALAGWQGSFDNAYKGIAAWSVPFKAARDEAAPHSGDACLRVALTQAAPGSKMLLPPVKRLPDGLPPQSRLRVRIFYRTDGLKPGDAEVRVLEDGDGGKVLHWLDGVPAFLPLPPSAGWQEAEKEGTLDPLARSVVVMLVVKSGEAAGTAWFDDVSIEAVPSEGGAR